jgi:hypothetical protein
MKNYEGPAIYNYEDEHHPPTGEGSDDNRILEVPDEKHEEHEEHKEHEEHREENKTEKRRNNMKSDKITNATPLLIVFAMICGFTVFAPGNPAKPMAAWMNEPPAFSTPQLAWVNETPGYNRPSVTKDNTPSYENPTVPTDQDPDYAEPRAWVKPNANPTVWSYEDPYFAPPTT